MHIEFSGLSHSDVANLSHADLSVGDRGHRVVVRLVYDDGELGDGELLRGSLRFEDAEGMGYEFGGIHREAGVSGIASRYRVEMSSARSLAAVRAVMDELVPDLS